jgi:dephospho-CoA kinase
MAGNPAQRNPRVLGLTGPIACGKTTVGDTLLRLGALIRIDADEVVHELMAPGTPTTLAISTEFGVSVLRPDGGVNRKALGDLVFADHALLRKLEAITHPAVRQEIRHRLARLSPDDGWVILDAVRLLQSELLPLCDAVFLVMCDRERQWERLTRNRGMTAPSAETRISAQPKFEHPLVTRVIENLGSLQELASQVEKAWLELSTISRPLS